MGMIHPCAVSSGPLFPIQTVKIMDRLAFEAYNVPDSGSFGY